MISIIAALDKNYLIGFNNHLPWHIKEDLHHFRKLTYGHPVVMGKNTWMSLGKPLEGRTNIILTHDKDFHIDGCITLNSISELDNIFREEEIFVIGGANIFRQFLAIADRMYLTRIDYAFSGDTYFPDIDWQQWKLISFEQLTSEQGYKLAFEQWERQTR
ncbi:MAG TPA: dihydrofolate reductase [Candidatus Cloacimonadota bacterium]|nr:dihydrofolate reductase [Candidatus Cloacimonadota bacterium]HQL14499.1 dihydrofolate reductase [Candidatus Cloacimonadota bacterium]